jgi:hypothetical protein
MYPMHKKYISTLHFFNKLNETVDFKNYSLQNIKPGIMHVPSNNISWEKIHISACLAHGLMNIFLSGY